MKPPPADRDEEFHGPAPVRSVGAWNDDLSAYQRLVPNPFLGFLGLLLWMAAVRWVVLHTGAWLALLAFMLLLLSAPALALLFHFHCPDCGASGPFFQARKHTCSAIEARRRAGRPVSRHFGPLLQVVLWLYALLALAIFVTAVS
jgi:hypothetical protein